MTTKTEWTVFELAKQLGVNPDRVRRACDRLPFDCPRVRQTRIIGVGMIPYIEQYLERTAGRVRSGRKSK